MYRELDRCVSDLLGLIVLFSLNPTAKCVCRVLAVRFIKAGRMGAALEWAVGAKVPWSLDNLTLSNTCTCSTTVES